MKAKKDSIQIESLKPETYGFSAQVMENTITAHLLKRYFAGECTPAEEILVVAWLNSHPDNEKQAMQWMEQSQQEDPLFAEMLRVQDDVWEKMSDKLPELTGRDSNEIFTTPNLVTGASTRTLKVQALWQKAVAVVAVLLIITFAFHVYRKNRQITIETRYGQVQRITLPDSSVVHLNGNSKISYKPDWQEQNREVWLSGEAFFEITHQQNHQKFTVHLSRRIDIEVLGTEFNVSDRKSGKNVVLKSGKIKFNYQEANREKSIFLKPGELIETEEKSQDIHKKVTLNPQVYYAWTSGKWVLNGTTLEEMLRRLKETYGIITIVEDKQLLSKRASGSIPLPETSSGNADVLVQDIASLFELEVHQQEENIYLKSTL